MDSLFSFSTVALALANGLPRANANRLGWALLAAALIAAAVMRFAGLARPFNHDEVYTLEVFADKPYATKNGHG